MAERTVNIRFAPETRDNITDAELCARWAAVALTDGRYDLAAELSHVAQRAAAASTPEGLLRAARARLIPLLPPIDGPTGNGSGDLATWREAARSHAPQSCAYVIERTASYDDEIRCGQPISWAGDELGGGWYHLDPEITDHEPELE